MSDEQNGFLEFLQALGEAQKKQKEQEIIFSELARYMRGTYDALVREGFTEEQAMDLTKCVISGVSANAVLKK